MGLACWGTHYHCRADSNGSFTLLVSVSYFLSSIGLCGPQSQHLTIHSCFPTPLPNVPAQGLIIGRMIERIEDAGILLHYI